MLPAPRSSTTLIHVNAASAICDEESEGWSAAGDDDDEGEDVLPIDWNDCGGDGMASTSAGLPAPLPSWPALAAERAESREGRKSKRGSYARDTASGRGIRKSWPQSGGEHIEALRFPTGSFWTSSPCDTFFKFTALRGCPRDGRCLEHLCMRDVEACLVVSYGEPCLDGSRTPTVTPWPTTKNQSIDHRLGVMV